MLNHFVFRCKECGYTEPLDHVLKSQIIEEYIKTKQGDFEQREETLKKKEQEFEQKRKNENEIVEREATKKTAGLTRQLEIASQENQDLIKRVTTAEQIELELRQSNNALLQAKSSMELEVARRIDQIRERDRAEYSTQVETRHELELKEKEKVISGLRASVNELNRKLRQESPQLIGEVGEIHVEEILRNEFPSDEFLPVPKGRAGADVIQTVKGVRGAYGKIIIEVKRTKNWSVEWITKIKHDQQEAHAELAVIVTETMPPSEKKRFLQSSGVWVCDLFVFRELILSLRTQLKSIYELRSVKENEKSKAINVYAYVNSPEFNLAVMSIVDNVSAVKGILNSERETMLKSWSKHEKLIERIQTSTFKIQADIELLSGEMPKATGTPNNVA